MTTRPLVALLVLVTGCKSSFLVPPEEAPNIRTSGKVVTLDGATKVIVYDHRVRPVPFAGAVFVLPASPTGTISAAPAYDVPGDHRWQNPWIPTPLTVTLEGPILRVEGWQQPPCLFPTGSVRAFQIEQANPGKTAAIVLGAGIPGALAVAGVVYLVYTIANSFSSGGSWVSVGCC